MEISFFLKKLISAFLVPFNIAMSLFFLGMIFLWIKQYTNKGKKLISMAFIFLLICSFPPFADFILLPIEKTYPTYKQVELNSPFIVVLGGTSSNDYSLPLSSQISNDSNIRLIEGIRIYLLHKGAKLVFTGWKNNESGSHPERMKKMAMALGISEVDIIVITGPKDTHDEAIAINQLAIKNSLILVTSAYHMKRAMYLFEEQDLKPTAAPTNFKVKRDLDINLIPSASALIKTQLAIHEYLGLLWAWLKGQY